MNETNTNMPILSVERTIEHLSRAYCTVVKNGISPKVLPSVMLWGPPGVGKSQAVRQIARDIERETGKMVRVTDVRLLLFNPIDLRGIPTANADKTLAIWLKPQIFQMSDDENVVNILFLDEISAAPQSVQAAAYQITLDRVVGEHKLPDNCIVIAAGNRVTDKSVSFKMPKALANRLLHIEVEGSFESWANWAVKAGIHRKVLGFLSFRMDCLFGFDATRDDLAFATPRSWEMVSHLLCNVSEDEKEIFPLIAGLVGSATAIEFRSWCKVYASLPDIKGIFAGTVTDVPRASDTLYAVVSSMIAYAREHRDDLAAIGNSLHYASKMPADYTALLLKSYALLEEGYCEVLRKIPEYFDLAREMGLVRNGRIR
ncbi:MAG: AAA family ATPase [Ruminococcaceae bacterium]|nr:AAA family ATPase [Oscillospiraceae bacterium]